MTGNTKTGAAGLITPMSYVIGQCGLLSQSVACRGLEFAELAGYGTCSTLAREASVAAQPIGVMPK